MNNITYAVSVDVNNPIIPYNVYVANVLDSNVRYLEITLYQNGNVIALSNEATATASLVTDNVLIDDSVACTISNNIITVPLEDLQRHGNLDVQVTVTEGTKVLAIPFPIQVRVTPNIAEEAQIDENSLGSYAEVVHEITEARGTYTTLHDAITAKLDNTTNAIKTMHITDSAVTTAKIADGAVTVAKVADDLAEVINTKEVKSNKKTTLTGNESSNDFYPTTKAVADALKSAVEALPDQLKEELFPNHMNCIADVDWELESGGINNSTGEELANSSYTRTGFVSLNPNFTFTLRDKNGNSVGVVYYYDTNKTFMSATYSTNSIKKTNAVYARFQMTKVYDSETTLPEFLEGFWGLKSDYDSADIDAPRIYTSDYEIVEANRLAKGTKIPSDVIEAELTADRLTTIIQNSNVNLLDRTKLETGYSVDKEGNVVSTTGSQRLMRAMPIKPNTQYTFSLFSGWGICNPCWLNRYGDIVLNTISGTVGSSITVTSPADAFYLRFYLANDVNTGSVMVVEGDTLPSSFVAYNQNLIKLKTDLLPENITVQTFDTVEANKLADEVKAGQATINKLTTPERLTTIIENNSVNLFDKSKLETGYGVDTSGNIITSGVGGRVMRAMPILPNTVYTLSVFNYLAFTNPCWLDSYGETVISMISGTNNEPVTVTSPSNAYYLRFGFAPANASAPQINNAMIVKGNSLPTDYVDYDSNAIHIKKSLLPGARGNKDWSGMKYIAFGDSRSCGYASKTDGTVTWDDDESGKNNYPEMIGYYTGISVDNRAVPGGAFANRTAGGRYNLSFDYFTENLPTDADIITIFLGTNDRVIGSDPANLNPTEERDDQTNLFNAETFKGAIRNGLKKIRQKMPEVPIIMMVDDRGFNATAADGGTTRADMIREVAREAGLPVFDIALKGMNQDTLNDEIYNGVKNKYWYHTDILHESILGNKMLAKALAGEMAKYLW